MAHFVQNYVQIYFDATRGKLFGSDLEIYSLPSTHGQNVYDSSHARTTGSIYLINILFCS